MLTVLSSSIGTDDPVLMDRDIDINACMILPLMFE